MLLHLHHRPSRLSPWSWQRPRSSAASTPPEPRWRDFAISGANLLHPGRRNRPGLSPMQTSRPTRPTLIRDVQHRNDAAHRFAAADW